VDPHRLAEARSLAYHRAVADRLAGDPAMLGRAIGRAEAMLAEDRAPFYAGRWLDLLRGPVSALLDVLRSDAEPARALRQATPFAGEIGARERWRIWRETREAVGR
jgi:hypothetical protein